MSRTPVFQYPTLTVWLDDDGLFLDTAQLAFQKHPDKHKFFDNPKKCLDFLTNYKNKNPQIQKKFIHGDRNNEQYGSLKHAPTDFDVTKIAEIRNNAARLQEVSVLVIDNNMPIIKGLDICYKLKEFPFKKILLTGETKDEDVISSFNNKIIDYFFRKDTPNLFANIQTYINQLEQQYFQEQTAHILAHLETDNTLPLSDEEFAVFFEGIKERMQIKEFYLIDRNGSFLLVDKQDNKYFLVIHTERSLSEFCRFHSGIYETEKLVQATMQRDKIPFFGLGKEAENVDPKYWDKYFYKPDMIETKREKYYWVII